MSVLVLRPFVWGFGDRWGEWQYCPPGGYVVGMMVKAESYQGSGGDYWWWWMNRYDDSAYNAIRLACSGGEVLTSAEGLEGNWKNWTFTKSNKPIVSVNIRSQRPCGGCDDTSTNGLRFMDSEGETYEPYDGYWGINNGGPFTEKFVEYRFDGYWSSATCLPGKIIIGFRTQIQPNQGNGDDTGLNRVEFQCASNV